VLNVSGQVDGCSGNTTVTIQTMPGTTPAQSVILPVDANCQFQAFLSLGTATGGVFAYSSCSNGTMAGDSTAYSIANQGDTASVQLSLFCGSTAAGDCQACVTVSQASGPNGPEPFSAQFTDCSSGGTAPYTSVWLLPDGTISLDANPVYQFTSAGVFGVCLQSSDATGCTSVACDTVFVGADGTINPPGSPSCLAGFWPLQAVVDSAGNGMVEPLPYEVWVWNLSSATDGIDSYSWSFGDGSTSAEAYPTHVYDGPGPYVLCVTITNSNCSDSYCDTISISDDGMLNGLMQDGHPLSTTFSSRSGGFTLNVIPAIPTGIRETESLSGVQVWPNPADRELNITLHAPRTGKIPVSVMDLTGKTVLGGNYGVAAGNDQLRLDISDLPEGLYLLRLGSGTQVATHRFVKLR
jgi:PKD repeat protein